MKKVIIVAFLLIVLVGFVAIKQVIKVNKAHSTFENYYAFRGCEQLLKRTNTYGICKTSVGQTIKIVNFRGKWYLDGDLPNCIAHFCF